MAATLIPVQDPADPRLAVFQNVMDKDLRRGHGRLFMAESEMVLRQLARTPARLHSLLILEARLPRLRDVLDELPEELPAYIVPKAVAEAVAGMRVHRGVLAAAHRPEPEELTFDRVLSPLRDRADCCLALAEGIGDVDNMGSLFRNAAAFGVDAIVLDPQSCDPLYRKAIRTSVGHSLSLPYAVSQDWTADLQRLRQEEGFTLVAAETLPEARPVWDLPRPRRLAVLVGAEGQGLSVAALAAADTVCRIPMAAPHRSLNVSAALAVLLYELVGRPRQALAALLLTSGLLLAGCRPAGAPASADLPRPEPGPSPVQSAFTRAATGLEAGAAWSRPARRGGTGVVYLELRGAAAGDDTLLGLTAAVSPRAELHRTVRRGDLVAMEPLPDGLPVPAGGRATLEPGGLHIMLLDLEQDLVAGESIAVTLRFARAGDLPLAVPVRPLLP